MPSTVSNSTQIIIDPEKTYYLSTLIGNGQAGNSVYNGISADLNALLGTGATLKGQSIDDYSEVLQINPDSLNLIVSYYITDHLITDIKAETPVYAADYSAQANETILFITTLNFI